MDSKVAERRVELILGRLSKKEKIDMARLMNVSVKGFNNIDNVPEGMLNIAISKAVKKNGVKHYKKEVPFEEYEKLNKKNRTMCLTQILVLAYFSDDEEFVKKVQDSFIDDAQQSEDEKQVNKEEKLHSEELGSSDKIEENNDEQALEEKDQGLQKQLDKLTATLDKKDEKLKAQNSEIKQQKLLIDAKVKEIKELKEKVSECNSVLKTRDKELKASKDEVRKLKKQNEADDEIIEDLKKRVREYDRATKNREFDDKKIQYFQKLMSVCSVLLVDLKVTTTGCFPYKYREVKLTELLANWPEGSYTDIWLPSGIDSITLGIILENAKQKYGPIYPMEINDKMMETLNLEVIK